MPWTASPLPVYGDGEQTREWLHVTDLCDELELILERGEPGRPASLIQHVEDRPGHDRRYSVDWTKLRDLGWRPVHAFDEALSATVEWYRRHEAWWRPLKSGE